MTRTTGAYHYHKIANSALQIRLVSEQSDCNNWLLCSSHSRLHWSHHRTQIIFLNSIDNILQSACRSLNFTNVPNRSVISRHIYTADYCTSVVSLLLNIQTDATKGATTGGGLGGGPDPPTFWRTPQLLTPRFCREVHRQASRVNSVYNTEEERKKKFLLLLQSIVYCNIFNFFKNCVCAACRLAAHVWVAF